MKAKSETRNFRASLKEGASAASNAVPRALHELVKHCCRTMQQYNTVT